MPRAGSPPRAPRLAVRAPADVRVSPAGPWVHGWTVNFSQSGVLFALRGATSLTDDLEFVIRLSDVACSTPGAGVLADLHGHAQVVRRAEGPAGIAFAAANIRRQDVVPRGTPPISRSRPRSGQ